MSNGLVLGLNAYHGDVSAALLRDGQLIAAVEEERFRRIKHYAGFPHLALAECLRLGGAQPADVDLFAVSRNPRAHLWRKALFLLRYRPTGTVGDRARNMSRVGSLPATIAASVGLDERIVRARTRFVEHHPSHLASAAFVSPFDAAAVCAIDGFGDFVSTSWGRVEGSRLLVDGNVFFPHSLGLLYLAITQFLGFPKYGDEYKMMGLAAYGEPRFRRKMAEIIRCHEGQVRLNLGYFTHHNRGVEMTWDDGAPVVGPVYSSKFAAAFGPPRDRHDEIDQRHADLAASAQATLEDCYFALLNHIHRQTRVDKICLAGGVALNCAANGRILEKTPFRDVYIQPASNDAGTSLGAALYVQHQILRQPRSFVMRHAYYGPEWSHSKLRDELAISGVTYEQFDDDALINETARALASGKIVGWFQGRMEFGPRALGNRSILADPRRPGMKDILNRRIKHREPFRPFCPSVLAEAADEYFENSNVAPFMVQAYRVKPDQRSRIPAVVHADGTARVQTVERESNPRFWKLLKVFGEITGVPVLINTSFNENEPIVATPREALDCFARTDMDLLVMGPFIADKRSLVPRQIPQMSATAICR